MISIYNRVDMTSVFLSVWTYGCSVASTVTSQQCNVFKSQLDQGPFCVQFACSPAHVHCFYKQNLKNMHGEVD